MKTIRMGIIGCGLMGRELACAAARWCQLLDVDVRPEIVGVCDKVQAARDWFTDNVPTVRYSVEDYHELLAKEDIDAVYCAVPHVLHEQFYTDIIKSGKHLLGEKPFGIDQKANDSILKVLSEHPEVVVRCSSEFPFFPACQQLIQWIREKKFGQILEVHAGFNHSSDMDRNKPINWKRMIEVNGEYGCMGDLGIHTQHIPFRMGWIPKSVYASLTKAITERPDGKGGIVPCKTWDNATLTCQVDADGHEFPLILETKRMSPGSTNEWFIEVYGLDCSAKFNTNDPNAFYYTESWGKEQGWCRVEIGHKPMFKTITGSIFEFGFSDSMLQMLAAFLCEAAGETVPFGCFTPEETRLSHKLLTAALTSQKEQRVVTLD